MRKLLLYPFLWGIGLMSLAACSPSKGPGTTQARLNTYQFEQLDSLMQIEARPTAIFLHAEWCRYCKNMEQTTFANQEVIQQLNEKFYFVSFDGESQEDVRFRGRLFSYQTHGKNRGNHELAYALGSMEGQLVFPSFVILNPVYEIVFQHNAFLNARMMQTILSEAEAGERERRQ